jgi:DNA-binding NarL/FixJ family response regulator
MKNIALISQKIFLKNRFERAFEKRLKIFTTQDDFFLSEEKFEAVFFHLNITKSENIADEVLEFCKDSSYVFFIKDAPDVYEGCRLLKKGAKAYAHSMSSENLLKQMIDVAKSGSIWVYPELMKFMIEKVDSKDSTITLEELNQKERLVALRASEGKSNQEIADELQVATITIKKHLSSIFKKLNVKDRLSLAMKIRELSG